MLQHRKSPSTTLEEDFKALGIGVDQDAIHAQATQTIEDAVVGIGIKGHGGDGITEDGDGDGKDITEDGDDPIDGKLVTRELLSRIVNLPLDQMEEADFDALLGELKTKELPEGDEELAALAEAVVEQLVEGRMQRIRQAKGGFKKKAVAGFQVTGGKIKRIATGERILKARKRKKHMRGAGGVKAKRWARTKGMRATKRLAGRKTIGSDLATDLSSLVSESIVGGEYAPFMKRIGGIFSLLDEQFLDESVLEVLESTWDNFSKQITEDTGEEDFLEAVKPVLIVIKRCLEEIEVVDEATKGEGYEYTEGGEHTEGGKETPKPGKDKGKKTVEKVSGQDAGTGHSHEDAGDDGEGGNDPT